MRVVYPRLLVEEATLAAACHGIEAGHGEGAVGGGPEGIGGGGATEKAGRVDGGKPRALPGYFLEIIQCPTATCGSPERSKVSTASAALHTTGSPCRLKEVVSTAPTPVRRWNSLMTAWYSGFHARSRICGRAVASWGWSAAASAARAGGRGGG